MPMAQQSLIRTANDICVYVHSGTNTRLNQAQSPSESIVVQKDMTWKGFKAAVGQRLGIQTGRIFNAHDEITKISDVVQGDVLRAQTLGQLEERHEEDEDEGEEAPPHAARPHSPRARQARRAMIPLVWSRVVRLAMMQCVEGYFVTGAVRSGRFCETLRARRLSDHLPVVIKRFAPGAGRTMATLRSFALGAWSARHPCFAAPIDAFVSCSARRPLGGARARRRVLRGEERSEALVVVSAEQASNLQALLEERIRARTMITSKEAVGWVKQLLSCLVHLHTAWRVAHRNIKLSNVLLDEHLNAYLSDVAMPRTDPAATAFHMRNMCVECCSRRRWRAPQSAYFGPEGFTHGVASEKDDMWALGCVITELVTQKLVGDRVAAGDRTPFNRNSGAVAQAVGETCIKAPELGELCVLLLDEEPARRPSSSEALWKLLKGRSAVPPRPAAARRAPAPRPVGGRAAERRGGAGGGGADASAGGGRAAAAERGLARQVERRRQPGLARPARAAAPALGPPARGRRVPGEGRGG